MRIAALALLVAATLRAQDASPCNNTPAYSTCELVFEIERERRRPSIPNLIRRSI